MKEKEYNNVVSELEDQSIKIAKITQQWHQDLQQTEKDSQKILSTVQKMKEHYEKKSGHLDKVEK